MKLKVLFLILYINNNSFFAMQNNVCNIPPSKSELLVEETNDLRKKIDILNNNVRQNSELTSEESIDFLYTLSKLSAQKNLKECDKDLIIEILNFFFKEKNTYLQKNKSVMVQFLVSMEKLSETELTDNHTNFIIDMLNNVYKYSVIKNSDYKYYEYQYLSNHILRVVHINTIKEILDNDRILNSIFNIIQNILSNKNYPNDILNIIIEILNNVRQNSELTSEESIEFLYTLSKLSAQKNLKECDKDLIIEILNFFFKEKNTYLKENKSVMVQFLVSMEELSETELTDNHTNFIIDMLNNVYKYSVIKNSDYEYDLSNHIVRVVHIIDNLLLKEKEYLKEDHMNIIKEILKEYYELPINKSNNNSYFQLLKKLSSMNKGNNEPLN